MLLGFTALIHFLHSQHFTHSHDNANASEAANGSTILRPREFCALLDIDLVMPTSVRIGIKGLYYREVSSSIHLGGHGLQK